MRQMPRLQALFRSLERFPFCKNAVNAFGQRDQQEQSVHTALPAPVIGENVIVCLHYRLAREPALGVVLLRWLVFQVGGPERIGGRVIFERAVTPSAALHESLAVLHHEINVMLGARHRRCPGFMVIHFPVPMDLHHLGAIRKGLAVTGNARLAGVDHHRIPEDRSQLTSVMADGDHGPAFVSPELREREAVRHFEVVLVLRRHGALCL
jgi:hypothetical protein